VHLGDAWGRGCEGDVEWEVLCSLGRLSSVQCPGGPRTDVSGLTAKRDKAVAAALAKAASNPASGDTRKAAGTVGEAVFGRDAAVQGAVTAAPGTPPLPQPAVGLQRRNIFAAFQAWLKQQGGQEALAALVAAADTRPPAAVPAPQTITKAAAATAPQGNTTAATSALQATNGVAGNPATQTAATGASVVQPDSGGSPAQAQPAATMSGSAAPVQAQGALLDMEEVLGLLRKV
jgi:hypothetical protein